jgi:hypothetical protein
VRVSATSALVAEVSAHRRCHVPTGRQPFARVVQPLLGNRMLERIRGFTVGAERESVWVDGRRRRHIVTIVSHVEKKSHGQRVACERDRVQRRIPQVAGRSTQPRVAVSLRMHARLRLREKWNAIREFVFKHA